ncbi:transcriptional regulator, partial [Salmonella enterica]|nr:transcriptional regulator [Salmonella enterica]
MKDELFKELMDSAAEAVEIRKGRRTAARVTT